MKSYMQIFAAFGVLVTAIVLLPGKIPAEFVRESGPIEILSVGGYFFFCFLAVYLNVSNIVRTNPALCIFVFLLALRELDFHARFTTMGIFKSRFYISPQVPIVEKMIALVFILILIAYGIAYLRRVFPVLKRDLVAGKDYAVSVAVGISCMLLSKTLDSNSDLFEKVFAGLFADIELLSRIIEECMEMFIPIFFIRALIQYGQARVIRES